MPCTARGRRPRRPVQVQSPVDHLVYATPDLERGMREIERLTGVVPTLGGRHPGRGTRNALIALGPDVYLEIVAPDPDQPAPPAGRWLGVDTLTASTGARLTAWAARQRADGVTLSWRFTDPDRAVADGVVPFFIDWGESPHPARAAAHGASLVDFRVEHPDAAGVKRMMRALELDVAVGRAARPALVAVVEGRHGRVELR